MPGVFPALWWILCLHGTFWLCRTKEIKARQTFSVYSFATFNFECNRIKNVSVFGWLCETLDQLTFFTPSGPFWQAGKDASTTYKEERSKTRLQHTRYCVFIVTLFTNWVWIEIPLTYRHAVDCKQLCPATAVYNLSVQNCFGSYVFRFWYFKWTLSIKNISKRFFLRRVTIQKTKEVSQV